MRLTRPVEGAWLRELREAAGLSQTAVAAQAGLSKATLCEHEQKAQVAPERAGRIVTAIIALRVRDKDFDAKRKAPRYADAA